METTRGTWTPPQSEQPLPPPKRGLSESPPTPCSACRWDRAQLNAAADAACRALGLDPAEHYDLWTDVRWALAKHTESMTVRCRSGNQKAVTILLRQNNYEKNNDYSQN